MDKHPPSETGKSVTPKTSASLSSVSLFCRSRTSCIQESIDPLRATMRRWRLTSKAKVNASSEFGPELKVFVLALTFKATTDGVIHNLAFCMELMQKRDEVWRKKYDKVRTTTARRRPSPFSLRLGARTTKEIPRFVHEDHQAEDSGTRLTGRRSKSLATLG